MNKNNRKYNSKYNLFSFLLVIASMIMGIGYATVNSVTMEISGVAIADIKREVYISSAVVLKNDNDLPKANVNMFYKTVLNSTVILGRKPKSNISIQITIQNATNDNYQFKGVEYMFGKDTYSNEDIAFYLVGLKKGDILKKGEAITFTITFHYKDNKFTRNNILNSYLNFNFDKLNAFSITYKGIVNNDYPTKIYEDENLEIVFTEPIPKKVSVTNVEDFKYNNGVLYIHNALGNITISSFEKIDFLVVGNKKVIEVDLGWLKHDKTININELFELTLTGKNLTERKINKIDIIYTYNSKTGSKQSMESILTINDNSYTNSVFLDRKHDGEIITTFDNLNIESNDTFIINHSIDKITNGKIDISNIVLRAYMS